MRQRLPWFKHWAEAGAGSTITKIIADCGLEGVGFFWRINEWICAHEDREKAPGLIEIPVKLFNRDLKLRAKRAVRLLTMVGKHAHWEIELVLSDGSTLDLKQLSNKSPKSLSELFNKSGITLKLLSPNWLKFQETGWQSSARREKREGRREKREIKNPKKEEEKASVPPPPPSPPAPREIHAHLPEFDRPGYQPVFDSPAPTKPKAGKPFQGFGPRIDGLVQFFRHEHAKKYPGTELAVTNAEKASLKRILQAVQDPETAKLLIAKYLSIDDNWFKTKAHDIRTLEINLTKVQTAVGKKKIKWDVSFDD